MSFGDPPQEIRVHGREGFNAPRINGEYKLRGQKIGDRVSYIKKQHEENKMVIWWWKSRRVWMMTRLSMVNTESAYACVQEDVPFPTLVTKAWNVYDKSQGNHVPDKKLKMEPITEDKKVDTPSTLVKEIEDLKHIIEQMQISMDDLLDTVKSQTSQEEEIKQELEDIVQEGEILENEYTDLTQEHEKLQTRLRSIVHHLKKSQVQNEKLTKRLNQVTGTPCESFGEVKELTLSLDKQIIIDSLQNTDLEEIIYCFSNREELCSQITSNFTEI